MYCIKKPKEAILTLNCNQCWLVPNERNFSYSELSGELDCRFSLPLEVRTGTWTGSCYTYFVVLVIACCKSGLKEKNELKLSRKSSPVPSPVLIICKVPRIEVKFQNWGSGQKIGGEMGCVTFFLGHFLFLFGQTWGIVLEPFFDLFFGGPDSMGFRLNFFFFWIFFCMDSKGLLFDLFWYLSFCLGTLEGLLWRFLFAIFFLWAHLTKFFHGFVALLFTVYLF